MQVLDLLSQEEREARFGELLRSKRQNSLVWKSPGGESMANVCLRVDRMLALWNRECANKKVIAVCHGEVLWAFRIRCEHMTQVQLPETNDHYWCAKMHSP
jgi:NAD+ kinase